MFLESPTPSAASDATAVIGLAAFCAIIIVGLALFLGQCLP